MMSIRIILLIVVVFIGSNYVYPVHPQSKPSTSDVVSWPAKNKKGKDSLCWDINIGDTTLRLIDSAKNIFKIPEIQTTASDYKDFVPKNWRILNVELSDFNHDNLEDVAIVIGLNNLYWCPFDSLCKIAPKILLIAFRQKDSSFHLFKKYTDWVLDFCQGAQNHEPFLDLICRQSSIYFSFYRGGTEIVFCTYQFKFQKDDFYLAGANCVDQWHPEEKDGRNLETDLNYTTGEGWRHSEIPKNNKKYAKFRFNNQQIIKLDHFRPFSDDIDPLVINKILP